MFLPLFIHSLVVIQLYWSMHQACFISILLGLNSQMG
jgi:hypothetical protein